MTEMSTNQRLNISIVAGRRPDLLWQTLRSFDEHLFQRCEVGTVKINVDPIFGNEEDGDKVLDCARYFFPNCVVNTPKEKSFTKAVQWLWADMPDGMFLHIEDDWVCLEDISTKFPNDMLSTSSYTKMVTLLAENHGKSAQRQERVRVKKFKLLGVTLKKTSFPTFGTSPCFLDGSFARSISDKLDLRLDPEKQMRDGLNPPLIDFISRYKCYFQTSKNGGAIIKDIGREWRDNRGIIKTVKRGVSFWETMR